MKATIITAVVSLSTPLVRAVAIPGVAGPAAIPAALARFRSARSIDFHAERAVDNQERDHLERTVDERDIEERYADSDLVDRDSDRDTIVVRESLPSSSFLERLFKRKGGGGGGRGGGGGGGRGGGSSSGGSSSGGKGSSSSNSGGRTTTGSGTRPAYGGGAYYGGGSSTPYKSGSKSPSGVTPFLLGAGAGAAAYHFWPGTWYHPVYFYPYAHPYGYYNHSSGKNESKPVACGCDETVECSCDENSNSTYMNDIVGNGSYAGLNKSVVNVADVNGTSTILINGTLENGTTAAGGTDKVSAAAGMQKLLQQAGWYPAAATLMVMAYML